MNWRKEAYRELTGRILPFWIKLCDLQNGGFIGRVDFDLTPHPEADKGCILNSRILWFFSTAARELKEESLRFYADHAYNYLMQHCLDVQYGGIYWSTTFNGRPADTLKHTYNQAFAIYALSAYYRLTGNREALAVAKKIFTLIEKKCRDQFGYLEAFTRDWRPESNEKLSENGVMAERTMNTLLHVLEGYSGLYEACGDQAVATQMKWILNLFCEKIYSPVLHRQEVFFDYNYHSLIDLYSYGHDIESSWLMDWSCGLLNDSALTAKVKSITLSMAEHVLDTAFVNGSLCNESENGKVDSTRVWWVQAEGVLGFLHAWKKSGEVRFQQAAQVLWSYIQNCLADKRPNSEWFWELDENGLPASHRDIVEPWKCPYHNGRMCLEIFKHF